jgi:hypothetical protein
MSTDTTTQPEHYAAEPEPANFEDYWGVQETFRYELPDGKQFFEIRPMDEGAKTKFQKRTNKGLRMNQRTQEAHLDVDPADERHELIKGSVVNWYIMQRDSRAPSGWSEFPCPTDESRRKNALAQLLDRFNPKVVQDLEFFIRKNNPWMQADMDLEAIDEEISRLEELRRQKIEHDAGEGSSASN